MVTLTAAQIFHIAKELHDDPPPNGPRELVQLVQLDEWEPKGLVEMRLPRTEEGDFIAPNGESIGY